MNTFDIVASFMLYIVLLAHPFDSFVHYAMEISSINRSAVNAAGTI